MGQRLFLSVNYKLLFFFCRRDDGVHGGSAEAAFFQSPDGFDSRAAWRADVIFQAPGWRPVSKTILAAPNTVWAAKV